jgi:hypothetical protein
MKNLLSENMLRFGTKNLSESAKRELILKSIMETIDEHGLHGAVRQHLIMEQMPKKGATVRVNSPSKGIIEAPVPTDSKTQGEAMKILGKLISAFSGLGTDNASARAAVYSINTPQLYYAVLWRVQNSTKIKSEFGKNFDLVGEFLGTDISFAGGTDTSSTASWNPQLQSPQAIVQNIFGQADSYRDLQRHLRQFNSTEYIPEEAYDD